MIKGITVESFYKGLVSGLRLFLVAGQKGLKRKIRMAEVNRPGLALSGYFKHFASGRVQVFGKVEICYLKTLAKNIAKNRFVELLEHDIPCFIIARKYLPPRELIEAANEKNIPIFRSSLVTMTIVNKATLFLEDVFSKTMLISGDFVEVYGVGVIILGDSGVGKSECALALIERGHRLIADDVVKVKYTEGKKPLGFGNELTGHHMEVRGLGIINVQTLFGAACVRGEREIDMVITLESWDVDKEYDRLGIDEKIFKIFEHELPHLLIPVKPGRDIALIVEVAALNRRLKTMGHHSARELNMRLIEYMKSTSESQKKKEMAIKSVEI
ncbi:HPr(Ser) kinase/phosphatase [Chlamydiota bacterium]